MGDFKIKVDNLTCINGVEDDPTDLCLHGHVIIHIGETFIEGDGTVSATALYLLKTLTEDKIMSEYDIQMIPCCGHTLLANEDLTNVTILGCDTGIDWSTIHEGTKIKMIFPSGKEEILEFGEYKQEVLLFADKIENFYQQCSAKILPENDIDRDGYVTFWNEWHRRKNNVI